MGIKGVRIAKTRSELNDFTRCLLQDMQALDQMLQEGWFESEEMKIGAEQEICLVDEHNKPAPFSLDILKELNHPSFTTELARFNLEANIDPLVFTGSCFSDLENQIKGLMNQLQLVCDNHDICPVLTGILPTIRKFDMEIENLTPIDRYFALIEAITKSRGESFELKIEGLDELNLRQASALIEACNTSFQVHLQIKPNEFVERYNIAQLIAAPVLAISTNSPMLFGKRLWNETRVALFQQSVDTRITGDHLRYASPRVTFGKQWLKNSILDLYKEDIVRYKTLLITDVEKDVMEQLSKGITPKLKALSIHNSTVYRWNRPCYGISDNGKPHLRIENRILPAGPTVRDEVANAALWIGLMNGMADHYPKLTEVMEFDDAKSNFMKACRSGLGSKFTWINGKVINDVEIIEKELIPIAKEGLLKAGVNKQDADTYLDVIRERNENGQTGSRWILDSYAKLSKTTTRDEATTAIVASMSKYQQEGSPAHNWPLANLHDIKDWKPSSLLVEEFMDTDIFTVTADDIPEFCADVMHWQNLRYIAVENERGELIGLLTSANLLRFYNVNYNVSQTDSRVTVAEIMHTEPITVAPEASIVDAMDIMRNNGIGCLPVVTKKSLVGMITEENFISITSSLLKRLVGKKRNLATNGNTPAEPVVSSAPEPMPELAKVKEEKKTKSTTKKA